MAVKQVPLDETCWRSPQHAQDMGGIHENNVLYYFAESPFCDPQSNNRVLMTQIPSIPSMYHIMATRRAFEERLSTMAGLEYTAPFFPMDFPTKESEIGEGRWVIRKQYRTKRRDAPDQVKLLATYFVIGESIYPATSIGHALWQKIFTTTENLNRFMRIASALPEFKPSTGYRYVDPALATDKAVPGRQSQNQSKVGTPLPAEGRESVPPPSLQDHIGSTTATSQGNALADNRLLMESLASFMQYGNEYMDERPILGEPGSFSVGHKTPANVQVPVPKPALAPLKAPPEESDAPTPQAVEPKSPRVKMEATETSRLKPKRRKSKAPTSPVTPVDSPALS